MASIFLKRFSQRNGNRDGKRRSQSASSRCPSTPSQSVGGGNLIYVGRSPNLPPKDKSEEAKHKVLVAKLRRSVRGKRKAEAREQAQLLAAEIARDDAMLDVKRTWQEEILPTWPMLCGSARVTALCWLGLPPSLRQEIWMQFVASANVNTVQACSEETLKCSCGNRLDDAVEVALSRASIRGQRTCLGEPGCSCPRANRCDEIDETGNDAASPAQMKTGRDGEETLRAMVSMDVKRTFPHLAVLHAEGPLHDPLVWLCAAFAVRNPDVGYIQGLSYLAGIVSLTISDTHPMIRCLETVASTPSVRAFLQLDPGGMEFACRIVDTCLERCLPELSAHFLSLGVQPEFYANEWIITIFSKLLPLDIVVRVWDVLLHPPPPDAPRGTIGNTLIFAPTDAPTHTVTSTTHCGVAAPPETSTTTTNDDDVRMHVCAPQQLDFTREHAALPLPVRSDVPTTPAAARHGAVDVSSAEPTVRAAADVAGTTSTGRVTGGTAAAMARERWVYVVVVAVVSLQEHDFLRMHDFTEIMCSMKVLPPTTTCEHLLARIKSIGAKLDDKAFRAILARARTMISTSP
eukprot:m.718163 g.718163  ORF g.718163 m.718163 type:complete len:574 (-) comp22992_c1_seq8:3002-4723(-)